MHITQIEMHQARNQKAGSQYLDHAQLVEHILKNLVVLYHVIFGLRIKVNLQTRTKYSGYNQLNNLTPRVRTQIQYRSIKSEAGTKKKGAASKSNLMHRHHSGMNHIHQLALHRPRRSLQQRKNKQPISTKLRTAPHIQRFRNHAILSLANKRRRYSRTDQALTLNLANRTKQAWPNKMGMRKGPDLLDLGEGELEGGIDPVQDLAPPHEVGVVHDPDA